MCNVLIDGSREKVYRYICAERQDKGCAERINQMLQQLLKLSAEYMGVPCTVIATFL